MSTVELLARFGSSPCRLYAQGSALPALQEELRRLPIPSNRSLHPLPVLADHLSTGSLAALHSHGSDLHPLAAVRSRYSPSVVPLTCMQYSISQMQIHHQSFLHYFLADLYPCDAVLATTTSSRDAQLAILSRLAEALDPKLCKVSLPLRHEVIPYPIDTDYFTPAPSPAPQRWARQLLGLPLSGLVVLYVGRFDPASKSDLQPLLLAFRHVLRRLSKPDVKRNGRGKRDGRGKCEEDATAPDVHLVLAGYDPSGQLPFLKKLAEEYGFADRLHVHTDYPPAQQALYYQAADIFVSLSDTLQENFGLTPVEAMSCGLPVVVSDWGGYQETVAHEETGFRVRTTWLPAEDDLVGFSGLLPWNETHLPLSQTVMVDVEEVADRLFGLLRDDERRRTMGEAARRHVLERYAAPVVVKQMEALWEELAAVAKTLEKRPAPKSSLYETPYGRDLRAYASRTLCGEERLLLTEYGREVLAGTLSLPLPDAMATAFNEDALRGLLGVMKAGSLLNRGLPVGEMAGQAARKFEVSPGSGARHLAWLVKHGLVKMMS